MENMSLAFENRLLGYGNAPKPKLPLLLVTGFLGSGKTTLLRHLLQNRANLRLAVLVNELGTVDVDGELLKSKDHNAGLGICTQELTNGCLCCSVKDDLRQAVLSVLERRDAVDYLIVETSGAADPRPVAASLHALCRLDLVVALVDASSGAAALQTPLAQAQVAAADMVLLTKTDLVSEAQAAEAEAAVALYCPKPGRHVQHGRVPPEELMDIHVASASIARRAPPRGPCTDCPCISYERICGYDE